MNSTLRDAPSADLCRQCCPVLLMLLIVLAAMPVPRAAVVAGDAAPELEVEEDWQVIHVQGQRTGYTHSRSWETTSPEGRRLWTQTRTSMTIRRFGMPLTMTMSQLTEEDDQGNLLSFVAETRNPPISHSQTTGRVVGNTLHLATTAAGRTTESTQPWDEEVKSPAWQERMLQEDPVEPGDTRTWKSFEPQFLKWGIVTLVGEEPVETELLDGTRPRLERLVLTHSVAPGVRTTLYSDSEGNVLKSEVNLLQMVSYTVDREQALKEIEGAPLDPAVSSLVKVQPMENAHSTRRAVYRLELERPHPDLQIPEGPTQQVEQLDETSYRITVEALDPGQPAEDAAASEVSPEYLTSSRQLECGHPAVKEMAAVAVGSEADPAKVALALERYVHRELKSKNFSTAMATAAEVAQSREGDCTEHAVLLAALLRVREIPSRVVVGLVYAESHSAFGGHMWTEAWLDGRWTPLDATLGRGGIGAAHIKFADSSLDDDGPAPVTAFLPLIGLLEHMRLELTDSQ